MEGGKRRGEGFARRGGVRAAVPKKKKREGSDTGVRARVESRQGAGKGEKTNCVSEQGECSIAKRELNTSGSWYRQRSQVSMRA